MATSDDIQSINASLRQVGDLLKEKSRETKAHIDEFRARLLAVEQLVAQQDGMLGSHMTAGPTFGARAIQDIEGNAAFAHLREWNYGTARISLNSSIKAALVNENGASASDTYLPSQPERGGLVGPAQRPLRLLDVLPSRPTTRDSVEFIQVSMTGDAAEQVQEGDEKQEVTVDGTLQTANIVTIAAHTTASRQVLTDYTALQNQIDRMIRHKLLSRLEHQLINGAGGQGKINGLLKQGTVFVPAIGTTKADIIGEALTRQADAGYMPSLILMNPLDWFRIQITKSATEQEYMFGSPTMPVPPALWNARVVTTPSMPEGTAATIDTGFATVLDREQASVVLSNSHKDYFTRNLVAILGELRAGLELLDTSAVYVVDISEVPAGG